MSNNLYKTNKYTVVSIYNETSNDFRFYIKHCFWLQWTYQKRGFDVKFFIFYLRIIQVGWNVGSKLKGVANTAKNNKKVFTDISLIALFTATNGPHRLGTFYF